MFGSAVLAVFGVIVVGLVSFVALGKWLWEHWYITIPVGFIIWVLLLGFEFKPREKELVHEAKVIARWIPFTIKRRANPLFANLRKSR